jgi:transposase
MSTQHGSLSRQAAVRYRAGDLLLRGFDNEEIMEILEVSLSCVQRWRKKVESEGLSALARKHGSGSEAELSPTQLDELKTILGKGAIASGYQTERWTSRIVADLIRKKWNVDYCRSNVRRILNDLGYSYQKPSVKRTKHSQEVVDHWRTHDWKRIKKSG